MGHYDEQREEETERERLLAAMQRSPKLRAKRALSSMTYTLECPFCNGEMTVYDPASFSDVIEGNKMRPVITCNACEGEGTFKRDSAKGKATIAYWQTYMAEVAKEKKVKDAERAAHLALLQGAYAKLTEAEIAALELTKPEGL